MQVAQQALLEVKVALRTGEEGLHQLVEARAAAHELDHALGYAGEQEAAPEQATPVEAVPTGEVLQVGIVLPTKNEPRWIQDEARFREALTAAGYDVEILFSEGSSATEKANVEALISTGIKVLIICPQDGTAAAAAAQAARDAGVKVISYDHA